MAGRFVRASKYRHIFGKPTRKEYCYDNLHTSSNAWDTNLVKVNPQYLAVNWEANGGGAFAVIPLNERGKLPDTIPMFRGHTAAVLDTDWNPFDDRVIASGSEDGKVFIWVVPDEFSLYTDAQETVDVSPHSKLIGHSRKVGQVLFNPAANNILASASGDYTIRVWDVITCQSSFTLRHTDIVQSLSWNASGDLMVTTSRDKKLRVWDVRQQRPVHVALGHQGAKNSRAVWMGEHNRIATTGFSRMSERQLALWEPGRTEPIGGFTSLDPSSGVCMPFWDDGSNCLYLAGKGDGNIRYYEYENDKFEYLDEYKSADPQRGIAFMPRRGINVHENEVMRAYKTVNDSYIEPISFTVPRRAETFQADIYPPAVGLQPAMTADEWMAGNTGLPSKIDLESVYNGGNPVEVRSDHNSSIAVAPAPQPAAISLTPPPPQPAPINPPPQPMTISTSEISIPAPAERSRLAGAVEQYSSMQSMADRFQDDDDMSEDDGDETSSFEEIPAVRSTPARNDARPVSPINTVPPHSPYLGQLPTPTAPSPIAPGPTASPALDMANPEPIRTPTRLEAQDSSYLENDRPAVLQASLREIKELLARQNHVMIAQVEKIDFLTGEMETLKRKFATGSQDQSERIRQLELELETLR